MKHKLDDQHYAYGATIKGKVAGRITGRFTMRPTDGGAIAACVAECPGDHVEIGVLYGGSLILAALAKNNAGQTGMIYGVDPFGWFEGQSRTDTQGNSFPEPSAELVMENVKLFGVEDRIKVFTAYHPPLPEELEGIAFDTAFIDGNHFYEGARDDWDNLKNRVRKYILMHDVNLKKHKGYCGKVFNEAQNEGWTSIYLKDKLMCWNRSS